MLTAATIADVHRMLRAREITCRELVRDYLMRIAAYDRAGPGLHAVININPWALKRATEIDRKIGGLDPWPPLLGVPVLVKDNVNTRSIPTTAGSFAMAGLLPARNATIVERLLRSGAIILAKTNLDELGWGGVGVSSVGGQVKNPYDLERSPGGSSSGTAVGLAADYGVVGIGTDTMGSIRVPAAFNDVVGIRPTVGLVSRAGVMPLAPTSDTPGPMARTVTDAARLLDVIAGRDAGDEATRLAPARRRAAGGMYSSYLTQDGARGRRVGVVRQLFGTSPSCAQVNKVLDAVIENLERCGAEVVDPAADDGIDDLRLGDFDAWVGSLSRWECQPAFDRYLEALGRSRPIEGYRELVTVGSAVARTNRNLCAGLDHSVTARRAYREVIGESIPGIRALTERIQARYEVDALLYPAVRTPPPTLGEEYGLNSAWAALAGVPAITLPAGFADCGLPVGVELLGRPWSEGVLISIAYVLEQATDNRRAPSATPPLT